MRVTVELHSMHLLSLCSVSPHAVGSVLAGWSLAYVMGQYSWSTAYWLMELVSVSMVIGRLYLLRDQETLTCYILSLTSVTVNSRFHWHIN